MIDTFSLNAAGGFVFSEPSPYEIAGALTERLRDTEILVELVRSVGASAEWRGRNRLAIHAKSIRAADLDPDLCARIRGRRLFKTLELFGPVVPRFGPRKTTAPPDRS